MKWWIVQCSPGLETRAREEIRHAIEQRHLEESFGAILVPSARARPGAARYYPGYLFVECGSRETLEEVAGDCSLVKTAMRTAVPEEAIARLMKIAMDAPQASDRPDVLTRLRGRGPYR